MGQKFVPIVLQIQVFDWKHRLRRRRVRFHRGFSAWCWQSCWLLARVRTVMIEFRIAFH